MKRIATACLLALASPAAADDLPAGTAESSFATLKSLVGTWRGTRPGGGTVDVTYRLSAGGTVLVETWALGRGRESLTLYHLDGRSLLATHYCPIGNQPRLALASVTPARMQFAYRDATNLAAGQSHQHAFSLEFKDGRIRRDETYREGTKDETDTLSFQRIATPAQ